MPIDRMDIIRDLNAPVIEMDALGLIEVDTSLADVRFVLVRVPCVLNHRAETTDHLSTATYFALIAARTARKAADEWTACAPFGRCQANVQSRSAGTIERLVSRQGQLHRSSDQEVASRPLVPRSWWPDCPPDLGRRSRLCSTYQVSSDGLQPLEPTETAVQVRTSGRDRCYSRRSGSNGSETSSSRR
jgi:hypothetical protein